jgi:cyclic-di-AMP phosphodiesterase PgpH
MTPVPETQAQVRPRAANLWRHFDRLAPRSSVGAAVSGHVARWLILAAVAVIAAALFGGLNGGLRAAAGAILTNTLVLAVCGLTLAFFRPTLYHSLRTVGLVAGVFVIVLAAAAAAARGPRPSAELVPIALAAVLFSVLFDSRVSVFASLVLAALIGLQPPFLGTPALFLLLVVGVAAAFSVRVIRRRDQAYYSILVTAAAYALAEVAIGLSTGAPADAVWRSILWGAANAVVSVALALMFLPPLEEFAGVDTYLKLLEWSDLNRPLMRRLSIEAPGTFAHTMRIANLSEAACTAIGANGLLARVGAYYHDIGKLKKPEYFVENQPRGRNPHDKLKPTMSATIIRNHVREGTEMAEEHHLPAALRAFITEHHGTGRITYFYEKARERDGNAVNPADFSYPGPVPQTAETAVCMIADGVEASAHVLNDPSPQKIREVIDHIVRHRIEQGQLREAPLTLRQLGVVKEEFARVLIGMYHHRIDYPSSSGGITAEFASATPV